MIIKEIFSRDYIDSCIADMEAIGYEYNGTDNRGRLVFGSINGNSTQAFPDWEDVRNYLNNGSFPYEFESYMKEDNEVKADDIDFIMNKYVDNKPVSGSYGSYDKIEIIDNKGNGKYTVSCNGYSVDIDFDLDDDSAQYVYYIEGEGPYAHNSYEYITKDIAHYIDWAVRHFDQDDDLDESQCLTENSLPDWQDTIMIEIRNILKNNRIYADIYDDTDFRGNDDAFVLCAEIENGDWKHEHKKADILITDTVNHYDNMEITKIGEETIGDSEDDTYSSIHRFHILRYPDDNGFDFDNIEQLDIKFPKRESIDRELKDIIKNAKATAKRDGYFQDVFVDKNGEYGFIRHYSNNLSDWNGEKLIGQVQIKWDGRIPNIIYVDYKSLFRKESIKRKNRKSVKESEDLIITAVYKGDKESLKDLKDYALSLGDSVKDKISTGSLVVVTDLFNIDELDSLADELGLKKFSKSTTNESKNRKSIKESIDLTDYKFKFSTKDGYKVYSKFDKSLNKGLWVAQKEGEEPFEISYEQARGFEPINPTNRALQHKVRQALKMESKPIKEDYKNDLKKFADANNDKLNQLAQKNGFRLYNDYYYTNTNIDGDYIPVLCFDFDEVNSKADIDKFEKALDKYFGKFDYRYFLELLPRVKRICIYY